MNGYELRVILFMKLHEFSYKILHSEFCDVVYSNPENFSIEDLAIEKEENYQGFVASELANMPLTSRLYLFDQIYSIEGIDPEPPAEGYVTMEGLIYAWLVDNLAKIGQAMLIRAWGPFKRDFLDAKGSMSDISTILVAMNES